MKVEAIRPAEDDEYEEEILKDFSDSAMSRKEIYPWLIMMTIILMLTM